MTADDFVLLPFPANLTRRGARVPHPSRVQAQDGLPEKVLKLAQSLCLGGDGPALKIGITGNLTSHEAYRLTIDASAVHIEGASHVGVWYGLQTLVQLAKKGKTLPCIEIEDTPDFPDRGFMLDISRNKVPTQQSLYELVDLLSHLKINQLQLYTEHTFAFQDHQLVWGDASPMTAEEIEQLDTYCQERFVELVPNLNSFGHMERWLRYPEYFHLAESPHGWNAGAYLSKESGTVLKPNAESLEFVDRLYQEMLPHFSSRKFNIGCDETWELGHGWSRPQVEELGKHEVYLRFLLGLAEQVKGHGREPQFWADILLHKPESIKRLPENMIPVIWGYAADHPFDEQCAVVAESGLKYYVAPGTSTWKTLAGNLPNAFENLRNAARNGIAHGARGFLNTNWGDLGHHQTWPLTLPGLAFGAAVSWSYESNKDADVAKALSRLVFGDKTGSLADSLTRIGNINTLIPDSDINMADRLFQVFFSINNNLSWNLRDIRRQHLATILDELETARGELRASDPTAPDSDRLKEELALSIDLAVFACERGSTWLDLIEQETPAAYLLLRGRLQELTGRFEAVWLKRNRPGGLHDSSARMRAIFPQLGAPASSIDYTSSYRRL